MDINAPSFLFLLLLLLTCAYPHLSSSMPNDNSTDHASLIEFKHQLADPLGIIASNWTANVSFCDWRGVTCSHRHHQRVTSLFFYSVTLQGTISPHLANLSFITTLVLSNNSLTGPIPDELCSLPRLRTLVLQRNSLSGSLPSCLFNMSSLTKLYLAQNNLDGPLPSSNSSMSSGLHRLQLISLGYNQFTGQIPSMFASCLNLQGLDLSSNNLTGIVPADLGHLPRLEELFLYGNDLTGGIPSALGNLTELTVLDLQFNDLGGEMPKELGNLAGLQELYLDRNGLTGSIPVTFLNLSMITILELSKNKLTGSVPAAFGENMPFLNILNIMTNRLSGSLDFVKSLSSSRDLQLFGMDANDLDGFLPEEIGNLSTRLRYLTMGGNRIQGNIPAQIGNLSSQLLRLDMKANMLTGMIPPALSRPRGLQFLDLGSNQLRGLIPFELGLMTSMGTLYLYANKLSGTIPDSLANVTGLQHLDLSVNALSSSIPPNLWRLGNLVELTLSQNALCGAIPPAAGNLNALDWLDLSENQFSGNISGALGRLQMLTYLDLSRNFFHGQIPQSIGELINIKHLNLSNNSLSGLIPESLGDLRYLDSLDLSFNMLEGQIPLGGVFLKLNASALEGNAALCGAPRLHFQSCPAKMANSHSKRMLRLLKFIFPSIALFLVVISCFILIYFTIYRKRKTKNSASSCSPSLGDHQIVTYHDLARATNKFSHENLLGRGNFGSVFKGYLSDGLIVAVKVLNLEVEGASKSFEAECQALSRIRHRNLIKVISVCFSPDFKALILEYMPNGSLKHWLHSENSCLTLLQRLNIVTDVALALEYLHHLHPEVVLHCDLKPSNILLDEDMLAHVSDFGIAKLLHGDSRSVVSASTPGTIGYIAPEYGSTGNVSKMSDVYSFGILLLEIFSGKSPTDAIFDGESNLRESISAATSTSISDIIDDKLLEDCSTSRGRVENHTTTIRCISSMMELGLLCSSYSPNQRMLMTDVVPRLRKIKMEYLSMSPTVT